MRKGAVAAAASVVLAGVVGFGGAAGATVKNGFGVDDRRTCSCRPRIWLVRDLDLQREHLDSRSQRRPRNLQRARFGHHRVDLYERWGLSGRLFGHDGDL